MGTIDSKVIVVSCPSCGKSESKKVLQKGSSYGASWQSAPTFTEFSIAWKSEINIEEPSPKSAKCNACGSNALVAEI